MSTRVMDCVYLPVVVLFTYLHLQDIASSNEGHMKIFLDVPEMEYGLVKSILSRILFFVFHPIMVLWDPSNMILI